MSAMQALVIMANEQCKRNDLLHGRQRLGNILYATNHQNPHDYDINNQGYFAAAKVQVIVFISKNIVSISPRIRILERYEQPSHLV